MVFSFFLFKFEHLCTFCITFIIKLLLFAQSPCYQQGLFSLIYLSNR